jgi:hypothetical protein
VMYTEETMLYQILSFFFFTDVPMAVLDSTLKLFPAACNNRETKLMIENSHEL